MKAAAYKGSANPLQVQELPTPRAEPGAWKAAAVPAGASELVVGAGVIGLDEVPAMFARLQKSNDHCKMLIAP